MIKRVLCLLLVLMMVLSLTAACSGDDKDTSSKSSDTGNSTVSSTKSSDNSSKADTSDVGNTSFIANDLPDYDMGGREFKIHCRWFGYATDTIDFTGEILYTANEDGTMTGVNTKKKEIIEYVQNKYNCKISGDIEKADVTVTRETIRTAISSGNCPYDMFFDSYYYYGASAFEGYLTDLKTLKYFEFDQPWWDSNAVEELSIDNKLFFALGDINTYDNDGTWVVLFNKDLYEKKGYTEDLYQLVKDGNWTFDKLAEIAKSATENTDSSNPDLDEFDTWGFGTETYNLYFHVLAAGEKIVSKDSSDIPQLTMCSERTYGALQKAVEFYTSGKVLVANDGTYTDKYANVYEGTVIKSFIDGRELFYMCGLIHVPFYREMNDEFGILPVPKYDSTVDNYYSSVSAHNMSCLMIPSVAKNQDEISFIAEELARKSKELLTPEYYDKQLKGRETRDTESKDMLDIIFSHRVFDLGTVFGASWGTPLNLYTTLDTNIVSRFESNADAISAKIEDSLDYIYALS